MAIASELLTSAVHLHRAGRVRQAGQLYDQVLQSDPHNPDALHLSGVLAHQAGDSQRALQLVNRAITLRPTAAEFHSNLGLIHDALGDLERAEACYRHALCLKPNLAEVHNNLGKVLKNRGRLDEALACYDEALRPNPAYAEAHNNRAVVLLAQGKLAEAEESCRLALQHKPDFAEAYNNLGTILSHQTQSDEAVAAYLHALRLKPDLVEAYNNLGNALKARGEIEAAKLSYQEAIRRRPDNAAWAIRRHTLCPPIPQSVEEIERYRAALQRALERYATQKLTCTRDELATAGCEPPFHLAFHGKNDRDLKAAFAQLFVGSFPAPDRLPRRRRPRVGFVVTEGHEAIFLRYMRGVLEHLPAKSFDLAVLCTEAGAAPIRAQITRGDIEIVTMPAHLPLAAEKVRAAACDVLFFFEVGSDTANYFLPFFRLAPVQCTSLGFPVTTGIPAIDYFLSSDLIEPEDGDAHYTERLIRFQSLPTYYYRPALPPRRKSRSDFGLDPHTHLYVCPQNLFKLHPDCDRAFAEILRRDPRGQLVLVHGKYPYWSELLQQRLAGAMPDVAGRVCFLPRQTYADFIGLLGVCDVMLDSFHYGGGCTTYDALATGIPIVTMPTAFMRGRMTAGCYRKMGMLDNDMRVRDGKIGALDGKRGVHDCVARSPDEYVTLALHLAADADYRHTLRSRILAASEALYEDQAAVCEMETFLRAGVDEARSK